MQDTISGFKVRGSWADVVDHGEQLTDALRAVGVDGEAFAEWDEWRPKSDETLKDDINKKTAEKARTEEGPGEKAGQSPGEDLQTAGEELEAAYERLESDADTGSVVEKWQDSVRYVARSVDSAGRKTLRTAEDTVYRKVMTQVAPYYFDNELVSANIQQVGRNGSDEYTFEVNVNPDDTREAVREELSELIDDDG